MVLIEALRIQKIDLNIDFLFLKEWNKGRKEVGRERRKEGEKVLEFKKEGADFSRHGNTKLYRY